MLKNKNEENTEFEQKTSLPCRQQIKNDEVSLSPKPALRPSESAPSNLESQNNQQEKVPEKEDLEPTRA